MNSAVIKWLLTRLLPGAVLFALLVGAGGWLHRSGYNSGHDAAKAAGDAAMAREKQARASERQALAESGQQALLAVRENERRQRERADSLAAQLADKEFALQQASHLLRLDVNKAVSDDNKISERGYNGLGPHGLRLYTRALGYPDSGHAGADHTTRQHASEGDGDGRPDAACAGSVCR